MKVLKDLDGVWREGGEVMIVDFDYNKEDERPRCKSAECRHGEHGDRARVVSRYTDGYCLACYAEHRRLVVHGETPLPTVDEEIPIDIADEED